MVKYKECPKGKSPYKPKKPIKWVFKIFVTSVPVVDVCTFQANEDRMTDPITDNTYKATEKDIFNHSLPDVTVDIVNMVKQARVQLLLSVLRQ